MTIGTDLDGTLLPYDSITPSGFNYVLARSMFHNQPRVAIITNQGGICFQGARENGNPRPNAEDVAERIKYAITCLNEIGVRIVDVWVCVHHPNASEEMIQTAHLRLRSACQRRGLPVTITYGAQYRKPNPHALILAEIDVYIGDADEDVLAASAANVKSVRVSRWLGPVQDKVEPLDEVERIRHRYKDKSQFKSLPSYSANFFIDTALSDIDILLSTIDHERSIREAARMGM